MVGGITPGRCDLSGYPSLAEDPERRIVVQMRGYAPRTISSMLVSAYLLPPSSDTMQVYIPESFRVAWVKAMPEGTM